MRPGIPLTDLPELRELRLELGGVVYVHDYGVLDVPLTGYCSFEEIDSDYRRQILYVRWVGLELDVVLLAPFGE